MHERTHRENTREGAQKRGRAIEGAIEQDQESEGARERGSKRDKDVTNEIIDLYTAVALVV